MTIKNLKLKNEFGSIKFLDKLDIRGINFD